MLDQSSDGLESQFVDSGLFSSDCDLSSGELDLCPGGDFDLLHGDPRAAAMDLCSGFDSCIGVSDVLPGERF